MNRSAAQIPSSHATTLVDPSAYADGRIFETYAWLRKNIPLGVANVSGFDPFWVVTRFEDVRAISRDNKSFPYGDRNSMLIDQASDKLMRAIADGRPNIARSLINMDPPDHMKFRLLTQKAFMPAKLRELDERIARLADEAAAKLHGRSEMDFVEDVALLFPLQVVMSLIGVPDDDLPFMLRLTQEIFAPLDPDSMPAGIDPDDPAAFGKAMQATVTMLDDYFRKITADRRAHPRDDIATLLANAEINGTPISDIDLLGYYGILATAGHDTTSSTSAAAIYALATQPETLARVKTDPEALIPKLVEEAVRWSSPVKTFMRSAAHDTEIGGRQIGAGDWLMLCYASANRDEDWFDNADEFDIDRNIKEHMAFGYGPHVCLGQHLARREIGMLLHRIVPMLKSLRLTAEPEYSRSFFVNGFKHLPIAYELGEHVSAVPAD